MQMMKKMTRQTGLDWDLKYKNQQFSRRGESSRERRNIRRQRLTAQARYKQIDQMSMFLLRVLLHRRQSRSARIDQKVLADAKNFLKM